MADVAKPAATEPTASETPAAPLPLAVEETKPVVTEASETKAEEPAKETEAAAPAEEKKEEKPVEPIYSGSLGYKAPGLKNAFRYSKKYFWFGEEAVEIKNLSEYLRGEKVDVAHPTAAWSSQTGKGLLYFTKNVDKKETPAGVLKLAGASELAKDGPVAFHFKLHAHKHSFEASTATERDGWFVAFEKAIEEAKAKETEIVESEGYKEQLEKLKKPTPLAGATASSSAPKKSTDLDTAKPAEATEETPARAGSSSSSSSSSDEEKKKKKSKSKSRSVSRGKRASFFGSFLGKKDKVEEKAEEKKEKVEEKVEDKKEEKTEDKKDEPAAAAEAEASTTAPVVAPVTEETPKAAEETKAEEPAATDGAADAKVEEKKPKPTKRGSIFGTLGKKLKTPTAEKKESDVVPAVPAKDAEAPAEAPKTEETPLAPTEIIAQQAEAAAKTEEKEAKPVTTPTHKEKEHFSFGKFLGKAKSPTTETPPKVEEPAKEATPEPAAEAATEAPKEEEKKDDAPIGVTTTATAAPAPKKRGSIFGNFGGSVKKEKDGEQKKGLGGLFRNASKSIRPKKDDAAAAPKSDENAEPAKEEEKAATEAPKEEAEAEKKPAEPVTIGDVVPEAVQVGEAPKSAPEVSAKA